MNEIIEQLEELKEYFLQAGDEDSANRIDRALSGPDGALREFLASNSLWGGAGSIADQGGVGCRDREVLNNIQLGMVRLGKLQIRVGLDHCRTQGWVSAYERMSA